jgi:hypothetical protein
MASGRIKVMFYTLELNVCDVAKLNRLARAVQIPPESLHVRRHCDVRLLKFSMT